MLYIPDPDYVPSDPPTPEHVSPPQSPVDVRPKIVSFFMYSICVVIACACGNDDV